MSITAGPFFNLRRFSLVKLLILMELLYHFARRSVTSRDSLA